MMKGTTTTCFVRTKLIIFIIRFIIYYAWACSLFSTLDAWTDLLTTDIQQWPSCYVQSVICFVVMHQILCMWQSHGHLSLILDKLATLPTTKAKGHRHVQRPVSKRRMEWMRMPNWRAEKNSHLTLQIQHVIRTRRVVRWGQHGFGRKHWVSICDIDNDLPIQAFV